MKNDIVCIFDLQRDKFILNLTSRRLLTYIFGFLTISWVLLLYVFLSFI